MATAVNSLTKRLAALEQAEAATMPQLHCLLRYEQETDAEAMAAYEAEHGPIGSGSGIMRVIVSKPGMRPGDDLRYRSAE